MKSHLIVFLFLILSLNCFSQYLNFDNVTSFGNQADDKLSDIKFDNNSNIICVINSKYPYSENGDLYRIKSQIIKSDFWGNILWQKEFSSTTAIPGSNCNTNSIYIDNENNIYLTGSFNDTIYFDSYRLISSDGADIFIAKINSVGSVLWAKSFEGIGFDYSNSITLNKDKIYITGAFYDTLILGDTLLFSNGYKDLFISQLDTSGNFIWANTGGSSFDDFSTSVFAIDNDVYITGYFQNEAFFNDTSISALGSYDIFIANYSTNGNLKWVRQAGGDGGDIGYSIVRSGEAIVVTGSYSLNAHFGDYQTNSPFGTSDIFVTSLDTLGEFKWLKFSTGEGHNGGSDLSVVNNHIILIADFWEEIEFENQTYTPNTRDILLCELDNLGNIIKIGHDGGAYGFTVDTFNDNIVVGGSFTGNTQLGKFELHSQGRLDAYYGKIPIQDISHVDNNLILDDIKIFPNPFENSFIVKSLSQTRNPITIEVVDITGKILIKKNIELNNSVIETQSLSKGLYILKIYYRDEYVSKKIIKI